MKRKVLIATLMTIALTSAHVQASPGGGEVKPPQAKSQSVAEWIWIHISSVF